MVFTFTQLVAPTVTVVGSGDALMEENMVDIPAGESASVNVSLQNVASDSPSVSWTVATDTVGTGTLWTARILSPLQVFTVSP